jgi:hypothetical protein
MPEGAIVSVIPRPIYYSTVEHQTLEEYAKDYCNWFAKYDIFTRTNRFYSKTNPNSKWDWWTIGGRYRGRLIAKNYAETQPISGELSVFEKVGGKIRDVAGYDAILWGDIDLASMKKVAEEGRAEWINDIRVKSGLPLVDVELGIRADAKGHQLWRELPEPRPRGSEYTEWLAQNVPNGDLAKKVKEGQWDFPEIGDMTVDEWIRAAPPLASFAVLKDGKWAEIGWWGSENPDWDADYNKIIDTIRPDQWVVVVDCHI